LSGVFEVVRPGTYRDCLAEIDKGARALVLLADESLPHRLPLNTLASRCRQGGCRLVLLGDVLSRFRDHECDGAIQLPSYPDPQELLAAVGGAGQASGAI
jgi:hypothetical protein